MLIFTDKYKGWGKQKPRQWGPISAVKSAARSYCEDMHGLGIIQNLYPFWDGSGSTVYDCIEKNHLSAAGGTPEWRSAGMFLKDNGNGTTNDQVASSSFNIIPVTYADRLVTKDRAYIITFSTDRTGQQYASPTVFASRQYFLVTNSSGDLKGYFVSGNYHGFTLTL